MAKNYWTKNAVYLIILNIDSIVVLSLMRRTSPLRLSDRTCCSMRKEGTYVSIKNWIIPGNVILLLETFMDIIPHVLSKFTFRFILLQKYPFLVYSSFGKRSLNWRLLSFFSEKKKKKRIQQQYKMYIPRKKNLNIGRNIHS